VSRWADRSRTIAEIPTPALLVDVAAMERNIRRMAAFFAQGSVQAAAALQGPQDPRDRPPPARRQLLHRPEANP